MDEAIVIAICLFLNALFAAYEMAFVSIPRSELSIFSEIDYGPDEGRPEAEVKARIGEEALQRWEESGIVPSGWLVDPEGICQSWRAFGQRVAAEFMGKRVLVVSSNGIIRFAPAMTGDIAHFYECHTPKVATGSISRFEWSGSAWQCEDWNVRPLSADFSPPC
jgi:probable phosphoglycerate mutase